MTQSRKFRVYLAGPISGCNPTQRCRWRQEVKKQYGARMTFLDPVDNLLDSGASPYEFVEADLQSIMEADGLLVNMWQESIGTAMGVAHAHHHGRAIVVSDPNHLENKMLTFFADAVEEKPLRAAKALWNLLRADQGWRVVKAGEQADQPFKRKKIMDAIRAACRDAKRDDILIPRLVLPRVIEQLRAGDRKVNKSVTTTEIAGAVTGVLKVLEGDASHFDAVEGVLKAWKDSRNEADRATGRTSVQAHGDRLAAGYVSVSCGGKSHATIWGNKIERLEDIPSAEARLIFRRIGSVSGITGITLRQFGRKGSRDRCKASVAVSKTPFVIEGKLFDNGPKGTMQSFQMRVQDDKAKQAVADAIEEVLRHEGSWAG